MEYDIQLTLVSISDLLILRDLNNLLSDPEIPWD